jgi:hypothetical protein
MRVEHIEPEHKRFAIDILLEPICSGGAGLGTEVIILGVSVLSIHHILADVVIVVLVP